MKIGKLSQPQHQLNSTELGLTWYMDYDYCQNPTQLNSTQLNSKATSVGVRHSSHVFHDHPTTPPPHQHPTTNFSSTSRQARELKFGTDTH